MYLVSLVTLVLPLALGVYLTELESTDRFVSYAFFIKWQHSNTVGNTNIS